MRRMGLDVGVKTIGIAISDEMGWTAQGIETIRRKGKKADFARLQQLIDQYDVQEVVVGFPKNMNGTVGPSGQRAQALATQIGEAFDLPVSLWDERLTTVAAERTLLEADVSRKKRKQVIDKMAAVMILQGYLDSQSQK